MKKKEEKRNNSIKTLIIRERNYRVFPGSLVILERARLDENYREEDKKKEPEREKKRGEESGKKEKKRRERARRLRAEGKEERKKETEGNSMKTQRMLRTRGSDLEIYVESMTG